MGCIQSVWDEVRAIVKNRRKEGSRLEGSTVWLAYKVHSGLTRMNSEKVMVLSGE